MKENDICRKAIEVFGQKHQKMKAMEELDELGLELSREQDNRSTPRKVITEIADVMIMVEQLAIMYGVEEVFQERQRKLKRLERRINKLIAFLAADEPPGMIRTE